MPDPLVDAARELSTTLADFDPGPPVRHVYNPLAYAWSNHRAYLQRFGTGRKEVVLVGMNPGPWGMAQTGVPFGEVKAVRDWMGLAETIGRPPDEHPKKPVQGLACRRSEVSGARLWGWARSTFGSPEDFFTRYFVANYCPLLFLDEGGRNLTPDRLPADARSRLETACDHALRLSVDVLAPRLVVGVGAWAEGCARRALAGLELRVGRILHPSPASPAANRGWVEAASAQLAVLGAPLGA
jgi:single-strand selective monofunctional uracil DNA glycosylase